MREEGNQFRSERSVGPVETFARPPGQLRSLPFPYRWEVTRRHAYYQVWWRSARQFHLREPLESEVDGVLRTAAVAILASIGVSGLPFDPADEFDQISNSAEANPWLAGTIHPVSCRGLLGLLIAALPEETLAALGQFLTSHFSSRQTSDDRTIDALLEWSRFPDAHLDHYVDEPIVSISPSASIRSLERDIPAALQGWKDRPEQTDYRQRTARLDDYLRVWDLREGWTRGQYDNSSERLLREVATELRISVGTVNNRYRSAFELITGHVYSPSTWLQIFGALKLSRGFTEEIGRIAARRPRRSPSRNPVPDSVISPGQDTVGVVASNAVSSGDPDLADLLVDIKILFAQGLSNSDIITHFGIEQRYATELQQLRERFLEQ